MRTRIVVAVGVMGLLLRAGVTPASADHTLGLGVHYWRTLNSLEADLESSGFGYFASYQYRLRLMKFEIDIEKLPADLAGTQNAYAPQLLALLGGFVYAGIGVGTVYSDGSWADNPFYILRGGIDIEPLPYIHLDIHANYLFTDWGDIDGRKISTDTITIGAAVRFEIP